MNIYKIITNEYRTFSGYTGSGGVILRSLLCYVRCNAFRLIVWIRMRNLFPKYLYFIIERKFLKDFGVEISRSAIIGERLRIAHLPGIVIGNGVKIGNDCILYQGVLIGQTHGKYPTLGNNITICANTCVLGDIRIGDNVIILANSVVTHDIPANSIVAGIPAKVIKDKGNLNV